MDTNTPLNETALDTALESELAAFAEGIARAGGLPWENPDAAAAAIEDTSNRLYAEAWLAYLRGDFEQVKRNYRDFGSEAMRLYASDLTVAAAASSGDYPLFQEIKTNCEGLIKTGAGTIVAAVAEWALSVAYVSAHIPAMIPGWMKTGDYSVLPSRFRQGAPHMRARLLQYENRYEAALEVAQTALAFYERGHGVSSNGIYLRISCAASCCMLGRPDEAKKHLLDVMGDCLPLGFTTPFAELVPLFGQLLDSCFSGEFAPWRDAVLRQSKQVCAKWLDFHNRLTKDSITLILSPRHYQIALFVARGDSRKDIAARLGISVGRLSNIIETIYDTLHVNNRKDLAKFVL
jgi:DNA-binding CsgD family transcriptional regulator